MSQIDEHLIARMIEFGSEAAQKKLVWGNSGNLSHKLTENTFVISGSGAHLENLHPLDFVVVDLENKKLFGEATPSIETGMHSEIYKTEQNIQCVFHSQGFYTTFVACTSIKLSTDLFPESMAYIENVGRVEYQHPGSSELAKSVSEEIQNCDAVILDNHGAIVAASTLNDVLLKTETLEFLCRLEVESKIGDIQLKYLTKKVKKGFLKHLSQLK